jgi:hypothetical protein
LIASRFLTRIFIVTDPTFPVTAAEIAATPTSIVTLDPRLHIPYRLQYCFAIERQVTAKSTFSAGYVGSRGISLFRSIDANAPLLPPFTDRPDPALGQNRQIQSDGYQKSNALELTFRGQPSKYFSGQVQYTLSKTYNNTQGITYFPANSYDPAMDWARCDNDRRHKFDLLGSSHFTDLFSLGSALSLYSGKPVNVTTGADNNGDGVVNDRPAGFARNTLHGPGLINLDINLSHDFTFKPKSDKQKRRPHPHRLHQFLQHPESPQLRHFRRRRHLPILRPTRRRQPPAPHPTKPGIQVLTLSSFIFRWPSFRAKRPKVPTLSEGISLAFFPAGYVRFVKGLPFRISSTDSAPLR